MNFANVKSITIPEGDVRSIAIGGVTVWERPNPLPYDAEVDYVESTGAQYVDTGVNGGADTAVAMRVYWPSGASGVSFGAIYSPIGGTTTRYMIQKQSSVAQFFADTSTASVQFSAASGLYDILLDAPAGIFSVGQTTQTRAVAPFAQPIPLYILARNREIDGVAGVDAQASSGTRIVYCTIHKSGVLVRDFIPVRVGTAGYLYDRAHPTGGPLGNGLYGSETGTPLVAGPDRNGGAA